MTTTTTTPDQATLHVVEGIVQEIIQHPDKAKVTLSQLGRTSTIKVQVSKADMPRVIGKGGANAQAIQKFAEMVSARHRAVVKAQIAEPVDNAMAQEVKFVRQDAWNSAHVLQLMTEACELVLKHPFTIEVLDGENHESVIEVVCGDLEHADLTKFLMDALQPLVNSMGKANGRLLSINIAPGQID